MENSRANDVSLMLHILQIHFGDRTLDFQALRQIINASFDPFLAWSYLNTPCRKACHDIEQRDDLIQRARTFFVKPQDRRSLSYICETSTERIDFGILGQQIYEDDRDTEKAAASIMSGNQEYTFCHPSLSSDDEGDVNELHCGKEFSKVSTKIAQMLYGIDLVGPNGSDQCSLRPSFPLQLSVRVDDSRKRIYYDCIDYKPHPLDIDRCPLPTLRQVRNFSQSLSFGENSPSTLDSNEEVTDALLDQPVASDLDTPSEDKIALHFQAISAEYLNSSMYRIFVPLSSVVGIILRSTPNCGNGTAQQDSRQRPAVLILELNRPTGDESTFAVRRMGSKLVEDNRFVTTPDWTPNAVASKATRHYIYGSLYEIKELAAHLCNIDQRIASMMTRPVTSTETTSSPSRSREPKRQKTRSLNEGEIKHEIRVTNTLSQVKCAILGYNAAPGITSLPPNTRGVTSVYSDLDNCNGGREHRNKTPPLIDQGTTLAKTVVNCSIEQDRTKNTRLTEEEVNRRLAGILEVSNSYMADFTCVNPCLKAGIQNGYIRVTRDMTEDTMLYSGECHACGRMLGFTFREVLFQPALIKVCAGEEKEPEHGVYCTDESCYAVNYISSLCTGQPKLKKEQHHCRKCPGFGSCECACADKSLVEEMPSITYPPSTDAWSGNIIGLDAMVSRKIADMDADRAMMLLSALGLKRDDSSQENSSEAAH